MSEAREINLGCGSFIFLCLIVSALWGIASGLRTIARQITLSNCIEMAKEGELCEAVKQEGNRQ